MYIVCNIVINFSQKDENDTKEIIPIKKKKEKKKISEDEEEKIKELKRKRMEKEPNSRKSIRIQNQNYITDYSKGVIDKYI